MKDVNNDPNIALETKEEYQKVLQKFLFLRMEQDEFLIMYRKAIDEAKVKKLRAALHGENTI